MEYSRYNPVKGGKHAIAYELLRRNPLFRSSIQSIRQAVGNQSSQAHLYTITTRIGTIEHIQRSNERAAKMLDRDIIRSLYGSRGNFVWRTILWMSNEPEYYDLSDENDSPRRGHPQMVPTLSFDDSITMSMARLQFDQEISEFGPISYDSPFNCLPRITQVDLRRAFDDPEGNSSFFPTMSDVDENNRPMPVSINPNNQTLSKILAYEVSTKLCFLFDPTKTYESRKAIREIFKKAADAAIEASERDDRFKFDKGESLQEAAWSKFLEIESNLPEGFQSWESEDATTEVVRETAKRLMEPDSAKTLSDEERVAAKKMTDAYHGIHSAILDTF